MTLAQGGLPITGASTVVVLMAHILQAPPRMSEVCPDLPEAMDEPILRMLDKDPAGRPATAGAALGALMAAAERSGIVIPPGMPHLRRPPPAVVIEDFEGAAGAAEADDVAVSTPTPARPAGARWRILGAAVALGLGVAYFGGRKMNSPASSRSTVVAAPPSPVAAVPPRAPPVAVAPPTAPPASTEVTVEVKGAPRGSHISVDGKPFGEAPGPVRVPFGDAPVQVAVTAPGYETATLSMIPNRARVVTVKLRKRADGTSRRAPIPSDLESPF